MLPEITKADRRTTFTLAEFIAIGQAQVEQRKDLREFNKDLSETLHRNSDGSESWVCKECGQILVRDINGARAMVYSLNNVAVFVKYNEMAVQCPKCKTFNFLIHETDFTDALTDIGNNEQKPMNTLFVQDEQRAAVQAQKEKVKKTDLLRDYLLKLK
jgi:phage FluMu protein Com